MKATLTTILVSATALSAVVLSQPISNDTLDDDSTNHASLLPRQMITSLMQGKEAPVPIKITTWSQPNCKGKAVVPMQNAQLGYNYDAPHTWSISISRDLLNDEQIDVSFQPGSKRSLQFVGDIVDEVPEDGAGDSLDDLVPTATEVPGVSKRGTNPHCDQFITMAPTAPNAMAKGMFRSSYVHSPPQSCYDLCVLG